MRRLLLSLLALLVAVAAIGKGATPAAAAPPAPAVLDAAEVEAYVDGVVGFGLAQGDIAGGVVVVVADGRVLLAKGYGFADVAAGRRVDPQRTLFRIASISKTFNAIAIMQLVEAGKLDLDADIERYLDFPIPKTRFAEPITLRHLLSHTAGLEDSFRLSAREVPQALPALGPFLRETLPTRVNPPGRVIAYSNYGAALAGYIAARAAGQSWDSYVETHILAPLAMTQTSPRQPLPARLLPDMSRGYTLASAPPGGFELIGDAPAGAISASGGDMARYMLAVLAQGRAGQPALLAPASFAAMFTTQAAPHPRLWGPGLAFLVQPERGIRTVWHNGGTNYFGSDMRLLPDRGIGVYSVFNTAGGSISGGGLSQSLWEGFRDRYLPMPVLATGAVPSTARADAAAAGGTYLPTRRGIESFAAVLNLLGGYELVAEADGTVQFLADASGAPRRWRAVAPRLWQRIGGEAMLHAETGPDGRVIGLSQDFSHFDRVRGLDDPGIAGPLALAGVAVLVIAIAGWSWRGVARLVGRGQAAALPWRATRTALVVGVASIIGLGFVVQGIGTAEGGVLADNAGLVIALRVGTSGIALGGLLALAEVVVPGGLYRRARLSRLALALAALALALVLWRFHVFGVSAQY